MWFYIICLLMKVIINLKIGHKDLFVAFNVIMVLKKILLKYYMFWWNTICFLFFVCQASTKTIVSCLPRSILLALSGQIFFSVHSNSGYSFGESFSFFLGENTFQRVKLLTNNVITANISSTKQFSSTIFDVP